MCANDDAEHDALQVDRTSFPAAQIPPKPQQEQGADLSSFERKTLLVGWIGLIVGFASLLAACIAAYFVFGQFQEMAHQTSLLGQSFEQAKKDSAASGAATANQLATMQQQLTILQQQSRAARDSVNAIQQQTEASAAATRTDQRAWLGPKTFVILNLPLEANKPIKIGLDYWNSGKTPALNVSGFAQAGLYTSATQLNFKKWGEPLENARSIMFSGTSNHILRQFPPETSSLGIPDPVFSEFLKEKSFLYIFGNLGYDDIFGFHHWTHFCMRYSIPSKGFVYCETFNEVDKESR